MQKAAVGERFAIRGRGKCAYCWREVDILEKPDGWDWPLTSRHFYPVDIGGIHRGFCPGSFASRL